jgi:hypothetical protein
MEFTIYVLADAFTTQTTEYFHGIKSTLISDTLSSFQTEICGVTWTLTAVESYALSSKDLIAETERVNCRPKQIS